ncbi:hypothetical protein LWI29_032331 [Acer saccharum]|uniref:Auxin response factor n=1 Tax=Acer saccharum TaxID=4024 RepID=A0AA39RM43_ACESA|nr:hypothetical protein LWI29_032331 [Acer saccharum]
MDLPTTKEKGKRDSTEISDWKTFFEKNNHNTKVSYVRRSSLLKKRDSTEIFDRKKFNAFLEEDSDHNSEVWSAFSGSRSSLPKKGDLVVYFPQGHLEYENPLLSIRAGQPTKEEVRTYDLQPQIICRVEHVQLIIMEVNDDIYANITLHPEPEVNSEEKELEQSDEIEDCIYDEDEDGRPAAISTPSLFSKILEFSDTRSSLSIPPKAAIEFFCLDNESMDLQNEVTAMDFHGNEWKFPLIRDKEKGNWLLGWSEFARARNLAFGDRVVFLREKDTKLRFGIRRLSRLGSTYVGANDDPLSAAAGAILKKSIFSVMYGPRVDHEELIYFELFRDFVIPYQKYMKSITRPWFIGARVLDRYSSARSTGVVTAMTDLDPMNWPNSKWRCLKVKSEQGYTEFPLPVSPWEFVFDDSHSSSTKSPKPKRLRKPKRLWTSQQDNSSPSTKSPKPKRLRTSQQDNSSPVPYLDKHNYLLSDEAIKLEKQKHLQEPSSIHFQGETTNHPFDIEKQTPAPQTSSQFIPLPDSSSLTSFSESKSTTNYKELKISNCSVDDLWRHLKENHSYEYLEFDSCSFPSSTSIPIPITIKKLKITNCVDTEQVFTVLMDPNLSVESLEIDSCSSFSSMSKGGIPATLRQLKIVNCMNLNSLSESFETEKSPSIDERVHYSKADILELRKLEIQNCQKLESLPKGMHKLRNLDLLSINDCCSLEYFPEGGFPITCLTSLSISGCENLKCLPNKLHKVTSLQNLSISGCPSLMFFPEGGLPPNLVSLRIIDCESLFSISQWELHKLKHLREYSFSCGCSDSGE